MSSETIVVVIVALAGLLVGTSAKDICEMSIGERRDCGWNGIDEGRCLHMDCCWRPAGAEQSGVPWCFFRSPPAGSVLGLTGKDCGDASYGTKAKISGLTPTSLTMGQKTTVIGSLTLGQKTAGDHGGIGFRVNGMWAHYADLCAGTTWPLPESAGTIQYPGLKCPLAAGTVNVPFEVQLSNASNLFGGGFLLEVWAYEHVSPYPDTKPSVFCIDMKIVPQAVGECDTEYKQYLAKFPTKPAERLRQTIFCANLARVQKHNSGNGIYSWSMGINEFSDWTSDEKKVLFGWDMKDNSQLTQFKPPTTLQLASSVDWRSRMPGVKNQKHCGSCWAFSAIDVVDFEAGGSHSEQQVDDCSGAGSCNGGNPSQALQYLSNAGSASESSYPYQGRDGSCESFQPTARISNVQSVSGASDIASALQQHVVSVCFSLSGQNSPFMDYNGGVYDSNCGSGEGHCVAAVGYGSDYWIIRNSWGTNWGEHGYIRFKRGSNLCGMESHGTIANGRGGPSPSPSPGPSPSGCTDSPQNWQSSEGDSCSVYVSYKYCTPDGQEDSGWNHRQWGPITGFADRNGRSALDACCGCGGGSRSVVV